MATGSILVQKAIILDARKLTDGGIGVYIENLVDGFLGDSDFSRLFRLLLIVPARLGESLIENEALKRWKGEVECIPDRARPYSVDEYVLMPLRLRGVLREGALYHSPHFTLPCFLGIPAVVTIHDTIHLQFPRKSLHRLVARELLRSALSRANEVITVSDESLEKLNAHFPGTRTPINVVPNAVRRGIRRRSGEELDGFRARMKLPVEYCLFVGSDRPHKGFQELLRAWKALEEIAKHEERSTPTLVVVGRDFSAETKSSVTKYGLDQHVRFTGEVSVDDLSGYYQNSGAVLLPSKEEGFGLVALEALALGVPLMATAIPTLREICGPCAEYIQSCDVAEIVHGVRAVLGGGERFRAMKEQAVDRAEKYQLSIVAQKTLAIYRRVLGERDEEELPRAACA